jgi:signal transduction histidine kinase
MNTFYAANESSVAVTPKSSATILVVDDQPDHRKLLSLMLRHSYSVQTADSGAQALLAASRAPAPDLILLDMMMPDMSGLEVLRQLRESNNTKNIPVIFVTGMPDEEREQKGLQLGAADYIHKPINSTLLLTRIGAQLDAKADRESLRKSNEQLTHKVDESTIALERTQLQLMQAEKMVAMGQLAAGVAHEINNPISFVGSNLGSLENYIKDILTIISASEEAEATLADKSAFSHVRQLKLAMDYDFMKQDIGNLLVESKDGVARVRKLVRELKDFSRVSDTEWQWADIHQGLDSTLTIIWNELKYHCTLVKQYGTLPKVRCLPSQINQVFMNLLMNAGHAIEGKGSITITTESIGSNEVRVSISDTGSGMPEEVKAHIFEPFFTTKPAGKGTGLGLSLSWGIIERHHGKIEVTSQPGRGTTFVITLPIEFTDGDHTKPQ